MQKVSIIIVLASFCCVIAAAQDQSQPGSAAVSQAQTSPTVTSPAAPTGVSAESQGPAPAPTTSDAAIALAHKYIDVWNTGDKSGIESFPDFIMHNHGGRVRVGADMLARVIANWRRSMPDLTFTIDDTVVQGDEVVLRVTLRGTYKERLFPNTGNPQNPPRLIRVTGVLMFKTADGKIQEIWQELDESILRVQMGAQWKTNQELDAQAEASSKSKKQDKSPAATPPPKH